MNTINDKKFLADIQATSPEIYNFISQKNNDLQQELHIGCHDLLNIITLISGNLQLTELHYPMLARDSRWTQIGEDMNYLICSMNSISQYRYSDHINLKAISYDIYIDNLQKAISNDSHVKNLNLLWQISHYNSLITLDNDKTNSIILTLLHNIADIDSCSTVAIDISISNSSLVIIVKDTLADFNSSVKSRLFHPFNSSKSDHIGLGLATAYSIALAHNGELSRDDNLPCGSIFTLTIPVIN